MDGAGHRGTLLLLAGLCAGGQDPTRLLLTTPAHLVETGGNTGCQQPGIAVLGTASARLETAASAGLRQSSLGEAHPYEASGWMQLLGGTC